jgi:signal transduction histidine kinase
MMSTKVERRDIFWYMILRLVVVGSLLVSALVIQISGAVIFPIIPIFYVIAAACALTGIYALLYLFDRHYRVQAYAQLLTDLLLITAFVYITGGLTTSTYVLYVFAILAASLVISARAAYLAASLAAILFGLLVDGMYFGLLGYYSPEQKVGLSFGSVLFTLFIAWASFFAIAFLTNYLSGNLRKTRAQLRQARKDLIIKERLAEAGRVSAGLAHEIRNPLAAISGAVQVLRGDLVLDREQTELMDIVIRESNRVSQSIDQFLDLAAPGKETFFEVNLSDILDETLTMLRASGELNGTIALAGNHAGSRVSMVANPNQVKQVFWNLAKNAVKAMPGGGTLRIDLLDEGDGVRIVVADTGVGMTEKDKEHLFEPFYSGFNDGRGLGLSGIRRVVDDYDGTIEVRSEPDQGTEIVITLPKRARPQTVREERLRN